MDIKKFWKETFGGFILKNLLIAIGIVIVLSWIALISVDFYTHHGETEIIPDLRGSYVEEAEIILAKKGLYPMVIDSVYVRDKKLGTIIEQIPAANSAVKRNRPIYLIINSRSVRQVSLPEINDVSFRQADAMLQSLGLSVSNTELAPSEYKDLVIEVKYHGRSIMPGTRIPEGSSVVLVIGSGTGNSQALAPSLKGLGVDEATQEILSASLVMGSINYDVPPTPGNEGDYFIYRQHPAEGTALSNGSKVDIYLTTDKKRLKEVFEDDKKKEDTDEQFF